MNNFNLVAPIYDRLKRLVFGYKLLDAQKNLVNKIKPQSKILVLGGGTGEILEYMGNAGQITYVEKSLKMIEISAKRGYKFVEFLHTDFLEIEFNKKYDFIYCAFFLDLFSAENLDLTINKIKPLMDEQSKLLVADFEKTNKIWHHFLLKAMHLFFKAFSNLESSKLQNIHKVLIEHGFHCEKEVFFSQGLIFSRIYSLRETS